jgi:hypothetical protein
MLPLRSFSTYKRPAWLSTLIGSAPPEPSWSTSLSPPRVTRKELTVLLPPLR